MTSDFRMCQSYYYRLCLFIIVIGAISIPSCQPQMAPDEKIPWMDHVYSIERFIRSGKVQTSTGTTWKILPDSLGSTHSSDLYSGSPGIILFYLQLYYATGNETYLEEAISGSNFLIPISDSLPSPSQVGLYTGLAGLGFCLNEMYKATKDETYKEGVLTTVSLLSRSAEQSGEGVHWGGINDIVYGSAGIGLFLIHVAESLVEDQTNDLIKKVADGLLDHSIDTLGGKRWEFSPGFNRYMDNFSHGTAGSAYFLVQAYKKLGDEKYLDAALEGANLLAQLSNEKGYVPHHTPGGEELYYHSWCHGPPGTAKLYEALYEVTRDIRWRNKILNTASHLIDEGIDSTNQNGFWNNEGRCCGSVGVADYFLWLYHLTGDSNYLINVDKMNLRILRNAKFENGMLKWVHAENRVSPEIVAAQSGLMQGAAGFGLWFLKMAAKEKKKNLTVIFPDAR